MFKRLLLPIAIVALASCADKLPKTSTINRTGIVNSDYPKVGGGWIKGWVVDCPTRDIVIVEKHAGPSANPPNNTLFVQDKAGNKITRTIISVDKRPFALNGKDGPPAPGEFESDIAICKVDAPFPDSIKAYKLAEKVTLGQKGVSFTQHGNTSRFTTRHRSMTPVAWLTSSDRDKYLDYGDSGTPWFFWEGDEWRVGSHTTKGWWGEGPWYSHDYILKDLKERVAAMGKM